MWLKLDIDGIDLHLQINDYSSWNKEDRDTKWCTISFSIISRNWLNYMIENDEVLLSFEVQELAENLELLLNDKLIEITEISCLEPDFEFRLKPKNDLRNNPSYKYIREDYEIVDIKMEWIVSFWNGHLTNNYLSIEFARNDIENLSKYLNMVIGKIDKQSEEITEMINKGCLYG